MFYPEESSSKKAKLTIPEDANSDETQHRYSKAWDESDIIFIVEDEEFHCHYSILKFNSPVFRVMFNNNFKEEKGTPVDLPGKEKASFILFLDLMYPLPPGYQHTTARAKIVNVLDYCEEYQAGSVKVLIDQILIREDYSVKSIYLKEAMKDFQISNKYGLDRTKRSSYKRIMALSGENTIIGGTVYQTQNNIDYYGTVFNELSAELKVDIITGYIRKLSDNRYLSTNEVDKRTPFQLLQSFATYAKKEYYE